MPDCAVDNREAPGDLRVHLRRYRATGDPADLETGLCEMRCVLELLLDGYLAQGSPDDLDQAVRCFAEAVEGTPPSGPDLPNRLDHMGAILGLRYDARGDLDDLEQSVHAFQLAIYARRPRPPQCRACGAISFSA